MGFSATKPPVHNKADLAKKIEVNLNIKTMEAAAWLDMVNNVKCTGPYFARLAAARSNNSVCSNEQLTQLVRETEHRAGHCQAHFADSAHQRPGRSARFKVILSAAKGDLSSCCATPRRRPAELDVGEVVSNWGAEPATVDLPGPSWYWAVARTAAFRRWRPEQVGRSAVRAAVRPHAIELTTGVEQQDLARSNHRVFT